MRVLAAGGDIGGVRAMLPALLRLAQRGVALSVVDHGALAEQAPADWPRVQAQPEAWPTALQDGPVQALVFSTSLRDPLPLQAARLARDRGVYVLCVLDSWMNYKRRLQTDGLEAFWPEVYAVMDSLAAREAAADGVPPEILRITGHPGLEMLSRQYQRWLQSQPKPVAGGKKKLVFISEPVAADQGGHKGSPDYRGYTEAQVLSSLCYWLQDKARQVSLWLAPHPREDVDRLAKGWQASRGLLEGGLLPADSGRRAIFEAHGVAGMASILLFEAWLLARPVISLQPGLSNPQLEYLAKRPGLFFLREAPHWNTIAQGWLDQVLSSPGDQPVREQLRLHQGAADNIADLVLGAIETSQGK